MVHTHVAATAQPFYSSNNGYTMSVRLYRNGSSIGNAESSYGSGGTAIAAHGPAVSFNYLDSPSSTSQVNYKVYYKCTGCTGFAYGRVNSNYSDGNGGISHITVMEVD
jgi:hypothetical protein